MQIRAGQVGDLERLNDVVGTIESNDYVHVEREGDGLTTAWRLSERPLRERRLDLNPLRDDTRFVAKSVLEGIDEGHVIVAEHAGELVGLTVAEADLERGTLNLTDLRVDFDFRRQGIGIAMLFQIIAHARESGMRAVTATTLTNNLPAARFLLKAAFDLGGVDTHFASNHDLVKEAVAMFWYAALD
jgi:GNAT superfamily N-acetyltransferase